MIATPVLPPATSQIIIAASHHLKRMAALIAALVFLVMAATAQPANEEHPGDPQARVIDGVTNTTVFGMGESIRITGTVKEGAIAFGGDVIVEGAVNGDVAAIGGSVIQREGARIGGDVIVLGGIYHHGKAAPDRDPKSVTIMYAGYEDQLRRIMRDPFSVLHPQFSAVFFGTRLLAILIWFVVALALTAVMPNSISRAVTSLTRCSLLSQLRIGISSKTPSPLPRPRTLAPSGLSLQYSKESDYPGTSPRHLRKAAHVSCLPRGTPRPGHDRPRPVPSAAGGTPLEGRRSSQGLERTRKRP